MNDRNATPRTGEQALTDTLAERASAERASAEQAGAGQGGAERAGAEQAGAEQAGAGQAGAERAGAERAGPNTGQPGKGALPGWAGGAGSSSHPARDPADQENAMREALILTAYETARQAEDVVAALRAAGLSKVGVHAGRARAASDDGRSTTADYWSLFHDGAPPQHAAIYEDLLEDGSAFVAVAAPRTHLAATMRILNRYQPIDLDERAADRAPNFATPEAFPAHPQLDAHAAADFGTTSHRATFPGLNRQRHAG